MRRIPRDARDFGMIEVDVEGAEKLACVERKGKGDRHMGDLVLLLVAGNYLPPPDIVNNGCMGRYYG